MCELYKFPASTLDPVSACTSDFRQGRKRHLRDSYAYLVNKLPTGNKAQVEWYKYFIPGNELLNLHDNNENYGLWELYLTECVRECGPSGNARPHSSRL